MNFNLREKVKKWAWARGYSIERVPKVIYENPKNSELKYSVAELLIEAQIKLNDEPFVIQIGAFDGKSNDFLFEYIQDSKVNALLVEPQPKVFSELNENYTSFPNVKLANVAIANEDGTVPFYCIKEEYHKSFRLAPQLATMDRDHLVRALSIPHLKGFPKTGWMQLK